MRNFFLFFTLLFGQNLKSNEERLLHLENAEGFFSKNTVSLFFHSISTQSEAHPYFPFKELEVVKEIKSGFSNYIWHIRSRDKDYIFRKQKELLAVSKFSEIIKIFQQAAFYQIRPEIYDWDETRQEMCLEYILRKNWPLFEQNPTPYFDTMKKLRLFHDQVGFNYSKKQIYAPFHLILNQTRSLDMPQAYFDAQAQSYKIYEGLQSWLLIHAKLCHGDFTCNNVLLNTQQVPYLIDFDSACQGDPFFDILKFSLRFPKNIRLELLKFYWKEKDLQEEHQLHFELMDRILLMVMVNCRLKNAEKLEGEKYTREEMQIILNDSRKMDYLEIANLVDNTPKSWQRAALYALEEFLEREKQDSSSLILERFLELTHAFKN